MEAIASGAADELAGRVLRAGDDLSKVAARCRTDPDYRRLRLTLELAMRHAASPTCQAVVRHPGAPGPPCRA